jgi:flagellar biosynthesis/type III secretory pathway M-ring protein FliF/YscJ
MVTPVVNLTSSSSNNSIVRNVAISLFALSQKISNNGKYLIILLILFIIAIAVARLLTGSKKDNKKESSPDKESPVIILPGTLPDEEIIIENPDEVEEF